MDRVWTAFSRALKTGSPITPDRDEVQSSVTAAAGAWPDLDVPEVEMAEALAELVNDTGQMPPPNVASELYLALACGRGDDAAIAHFEARFFGGIDLALMRICTDRNRVEDIKQLLRARLFVPAPDRRARVVDAVGRGELAAFVRIAATRLALNEARGQKRRDLRSAALGAEGVLLEPAADTPELEVIRRTHAARFKQAFEDAIARLSPRERTLLRYHLVEHLTIDDLATMHAVHRSSAARWLANARRRVAEYTQERLADIFDDDTALPALLGLVRSRLDLSITRVLASDAEPPS